MNSKLVIVILAVLLSVSSCSKLLNEDTQTIGLDRTAVESLSNQLFLTLADRVFYSDHFQQLFLIQRDAIVKISAHIESDSIEPEGFKAYLESLLSSNLIGEEDILFLMSVLEIESMNDFIAYSDSIRALQLSLEAGFPTLYSNTTEGDSLRSEIISMLVDSFDDYNASSGNAIDFRSGGCCGCASSAAGCDWYSYCSQYRQCANNAWSSGIQIFLGATGVGGLAGPYGAALGGSIGAVFGSYWVASGIALCQLQLNHQCQRYCPCW
ncbi:MAG: hypothetical protein KF852_01060 [Saprospiraceae bacterium]|nr:hypothetical protein [Saprospiraceae bacterium]